MWIFPPLTRRAIWMCLRTGGAALPVNKRSGKRKNERIAISFKQAGASGILVWDQLNTHQSKAWKREIEDILGGGGCNAPDGRHPSKRPLRPRPKPQSSGLGGISRRYSAPGSLPSQAARHGGSHSRPTSLGGSRSSKTQRQAGLVTLLRSPFLCSAIKTQDPISAKLFEFN